MSGDANGSESQDQNAGGNGQNEGGDGQNPPKKDFVSYETHRKLLDEKKKAQAQLSEYQQREAEREKKELEQKGEWQKIIELEKKRADEADQKLKGLEGQFTEAKKMGAILKALDNGVDEKFFGFLPLDQVILDPETGEVNLNSVAQVADNFRKTYPELLKPKNGPRLPNGSPQTPPGPSTISEADWKKLSATEMKKWKYNQIIWE